MNKLIFIHILALTLVSCAKPNADQQPVSVNLEPIAEEPSQPNCIDNTYYEGYNQGFNDGEHLSYKIGYEDGFSVGYHQALEDLDKPGKGLKSKKDKDD